MLRPLTVVVLAGGVVPTWIFVFSSLRWSGRPCTSAFRAWAIALGCALVWPLWLAQYRHWKAKDAEARRKAENQRAHDLAAVDAIEKELRELSP